eukprot:GHRR01028721.1.p1 GENE.GHRR01028721.1~~GHRR01028721.1.p1  ORF type:complete len:107 (+),score=26.77 GHRR01028721.1:451-771(+)
MLRSERRCAMRKTAVMSSNAAIGASKGLLSTCLRRNKHHQWPAIDAAQTMLAGRQQHQQQQQLPAGQQFLKLVRVYRSATYTAYLLTWQGSLQSSCLDCNTCCWQP